MLATIIPYFLFAFISDKSTWPNGPEFKFDSDVEILISGIDGPNHIVGLNMTNEFTCRPKSEVSLQCHFRQNNLVGYEINTNTVEIKSNGEIGRETFESFYFEIQFDKKGVNKITLKEVQSNKEAALDIAKSMASALNVATDINGLKIGDEKFEFGKVQNLIADQCKGDVVANMQSSLEEDNSKGAEWNLELMPPLEKLAGRNLNIMKTWNMSNCNTANKFFWLGIFVDFAREDSPTRENVTVAMLKTDDKITITNGNFNYVTVANMKLLAKKTHTPFEEKKLDIQESSQIRLRSVQPARGIWPEIENAVTIDLKERK